MTSPTETTILCCNDSQKTPSLFFSVRLLLAFLIFLSAGTQYMQKIDIGIAIVCMVNSTDSNNVHSHFRSSYLSSNFTNDTCLFKPTNGSSKTSGEFNWSKSTQGFVLSSYFYGYILTQVISGWLSLKFGGKIVLATSMLLGSVMTLLVPVSARFGYMALICCRFLNGLAHGMVWPAISDIFIRWVPVAEKSRLIGFSSAGNNLGNIIALPLGSYLCVNGFDNGWGSIFYIYGLIGIVWFIFFTTLTSNSPETHKFISKIEKDYIVRNTDSKKKLLSVQSITIKTDNEDAMSIQQNSKKQPTPWRLIFLSKPCIAIYFAHFSSNWGNYLFLTQLPSFMNDILKFDIKSNGLFSSLPYITCWACAILSSIISDKLIDSQILSRLNVRKVFSAFGLFVPMVATLVLAFVDCSNPYLAVALLAIGVGFLGLSTGAGYIININEVGGIYSGVLFGISNTFGTIPGIVAPYIVGLLTTNKLQSEWRVVFIITSVIYLVGGVMYLLFCDAKPQPWAVREEVNEESE